MAGQKVLHRLGDGELHVHHSAVAQDHDKKTQAAARLSDVDRAEGAPIDLGALAGGKGAGEKSGLTRGPDGAHVSFDQGVATIKALLAQVLQDLRGAVGILLQHADNLCLKRIEFTGALRRFPGPEALLGEPVGHGARIEGQGGGNLSSAEALLCVEMFDLAKTGVIDHDKTSQIWANTALMSTASSSPAGVARPGPLASSPRAKTW